jgi:iron complex transport system substrate-binding protein
MHVPFHRHLLCLLAAALGLLVVCAPSLSAGQITDHVGRTVHIPEKIERIVCLAPSLTECVFALGQGDRVIGATQYADSPPEAARLPRVGSYVNLDLERIVALQPDLCLATRDGNPKSVIQRLESVDIPVYALDPRDLESMLGCLLDLGKVLQAEPRAAELVSRLRSRIERVEERVGQAARRPRVFFQIGISPIVSAGTNTFIHELIERAGGVNLAAGPAAYPRYSREEVLVMDPEVIIVTSMSGRGKRLEQAVRMWQEYSRIEAVRNGRIHAVLADRFNRASPRLVKGLERLARLLHPSLFEASNEEHAKAP